MHEQQSICVYASLFFNCMKCVHFQYIMWQLLRFNQISQQLLGGNYLSNLCRHKFKIKAKCNAIKTGRRNYDNE